MPDDSGVPARPTALTPARALLQAMDQGGDKAAFAAWGTGALLTRAAAETTPEGFGAIVERFRNGPSPADDPSAGPSLDGGDEDILLADASRGATATDAGGGVMPAAAGKKADPRAGKPAGPAASPQEAGILKSRRDFEKAEETLHGTGTLAGKSEYARRLKDSEREALFKSLAEKARAAVKSGSGEYDFDLLSLVMDEEYLRDYDEMRKNMGKVERMKGLSEEDKLANIQKLGKEFDAKHSFEKMFSKEYQQAKNAVTAGWSEKLRSPESASAVRGILDDPNLSHRKKALAVVEFMRERAGLDITEVTIVRSSRKDWFAEVEPDKPGVIRFNERYFDKPLESPMREPDTATILKDSEGNNKTIFDCLVEKLYHEATHGYQARLIAGDIPLPPGTERDVGLFRRNKKTYVQPYELTRPSHYTKQPVERDAQHSERAAADLVKHWNAFWGK